MKFNDHEQRLVAVEEVISHIRQGMADTSMKGKESLKMYFELFFHMCIFKFNLIAFRIINSFCQSENEKGVPITSCTDCPACIFRGYE